MISLTDFIHESQEVIDFDSLSNADIKKISHKLSQLSKRQGHYVDELQIQMSFKPLYGLNTYIDYNDIRFDEVDGKDVIIVSFKDTKVPELSGTRYYNEEDEEWEEI